MSNLQKFNTTLEDFDKEVGKLKAVSEAYQKLQRLTVTYDKIIKQIEQSSNTLKNLNEFQKAHLLRAEKKINELSNLIEIKIEQIRKENKDFYKDLEGTIRIKLDDNKSEIKHLIENERARIKEIFEIEFAKNTKELRQIIESETNKQTQLIIRNQKGIKISLFVLGGLTVLLITSLIIKQ